MISLLLLTACPNYAINVIPAAAGPRGGFGGPFMLMRYDKHLAVASVDDRTTTLFLDQ
jgi:hypothetical protein